MEDPLIRKLNQEFKEFREYVQDILTQREVILDRITRMLEAQDKRITAMEKRQDKQEKWQQRLIWVGSSVTIAVAVIAGLLKLIEASTK